MYRKLPLPHWTYRLIRRLRKAAEALDFVWFLVLIAVIAMALVVNFVDGFVP